MSNQFNTSEIICNYHCPVCKQSGKLPNLKGRFFLIDDNNCQCNGCNTIFDKLLYYKNTLPVVEGTLLNNIEYNNYIQSFGIDCTEYIEVIDFNEPSRPQIPDIITDESVVWNTAYPV